MNLTEVLDRIKQGETMKDIAESMGITTKSIQRQLKRDGYHYNKALREWRLMNEEERETAASTVETKPTAKPKRPKEPQDQLTAEEIRQIRQLLARSNAEPINSTDNIHDRIKGLEKADRSRKTVIIRDDITERLDNLIKRERIFKSDALEIAILDFLEKYE